MSEVVNTIVSSGVDYLTATFTSKRTTKLVAEKAFDILETEMSSGSRRRPWGMEGFSGWRAGAIEVGQRNEEVIVRLSSYLAHTNWKWFAAKAANVSRIDLEVTHRNEKDANRRINTHYQQAKRFVQAGHSVADVGYRRSLKGPSTVYFGSRVSDRFGRIYNKHLESGLDYYAGCVRYEVELKKRAAKLAVAQLLNPDYGETSIDAKCHSFFCDRGCRLEWFSTSQDNNYCPAIIRDADRSLRWLHEVVRPCVRRLCLDGRSKEVIQALDIRSLFNEEV
jgi:DNA relaxase NicK